jgi:sirohydrochlorin cobaltochelatase
MLQSTSVTPEDRAELFALDAKINGLLPPQYQNCYDAVKPVSMGTAELVYGNDGKVAWDQIWTSFCELALAGGPPHRGTLLQAVSPEEVYEAPEQYQEVVKEIARGIWLVTELPVLPHIAPGWVGVRCWSLAMASWMVRAIVVENISVRREQELIYLPAGPQFRLTKEIKNVITALAKTYHYWTFHMPANTGMDSASMVNAVATELLEPALPWEAGAEPEAYRSVVEEIERDIQQATGLATLPSNHIGWIGVQCADVDAVVWLMRALIVENIMVRMEGDRLFLPASPKFKETQKTQKIVHALDKACKLREIFLRLKSQGVL